MNAEQQIVKDWLNDQMTNLTAWIDFWPFLKLTVENCFVPRATLVTTRTIQALYDQICDEVHSYVYSCESIMRMLTTV